MFDRSYVAFRADSRYGYYLDYTSTDPYDDERVKSYDDMLHRTLSKIFREHRQPRSCFVRSVWPFIWPLAKCTKGQTMVELLRASERDSMVEVILEREPGLGEIFPERNKLPLLWIAVLGCYQQSAELLVRSGAYVNERCEIKLDHYAQEKWSILQLLLKMYPSSWNERFVALLLDHGADLQARDPHGDTVLHYAVSRCRVRLTELFLKRGADVEASGDEGKTALLAAASGKRAEELVPLLLKHGADASVRDNEGNNALHCLACGPDVDAKHVDLARSLIEKGASLHDRDRTRQYRPTHWAVLCGKHELVKLFLDHGADVNARATGGLFPLYFAVQYNCPTALLTTLLKRGANVDLKTIKGQTALHNACKYFNRKNLEKIKMLLSVGADMFAEDHAGRTPFALMDLDDMEDIEDVMANPSVRLMLRTLALSRACLRHQPSIEFKDEGIIKRYPKLWDYYQDCHAHISEAKSAMFSKGCAFFELLAKDHYQIAARLRNPNFKSNLKLRDLKGFSMYAEDILEAFEHVQSHYRSGICNILPWMVVRKVARYIVNCEECELKRIVHASRTNGDNCAN